MYESSIAQYFAQRGLEEGIQQGLILAVLDLINKQFNPSRAEQLKPTVESIQDTALLQEILVNVSEARTFNELLETVETLIS